MGRIKQLEKQVTQLQDAFNTLARALGQDPADLQPPTTADDAAEPGDGDALSEEYGDFFPDVPPAAASADLSALIEANSEDDEPSRRVRRRTS